MIGRIFGTFVMAAVVAIIASLVGSSKYASDTYDRQDMIRKLRDEGQDWKQVTLTLNTAGYKNKDGGQLTEDDVREEFAKMTVEDGRG